MSETAALAELLAGFAWDGLPEDVRALAREIVLDGLACGVGGSETDLPALMREAVGVPGPAVALLLDGRARTTPGIAAYLNAAGINALDYDDTAPTSEHPGASVIAAALATAEQTGASGAAFLTGVVAGYETTMRVGAACRWSAERYELVHGIGTFLALGAGAAAATVRGLDAAGLRRTFGIAGPMSGLPHAGKFGWDEPRLSWLKDNVAWAAEAGYRAAALAAASFPATETIFDGEKGFWRMAAGDVYQPAVLVDRARFFIREIGFKTYPCCRWLHGMLDAGAAVRDDRAFGVHEIARVRVEAARTIAATFGDPRPGSMVDAQFSAPHALAMLLREIPYPQWWRAEHRAEAATHALADWVELVEDPALTERFHALGRDSNRIPARVRVTLTDGWSGEAYNEEASGAAGRRPAEGGAGPDDARLAAKRADLLATRLSPDRCAALTHAVARLAEAPDVAALSSLLEATSPG